MPHRAQLHDTVRLPPERVVRTKALDQSQDDLLHRFAKLRARAGDRRCRAPDLTDGEPLGHGLGAQPQVDGEPCRLMVPDVPFETTGREASGARELGAERLVESDAVQRAHQRAHQLGDQHAIAGMPAIARCEELDLGAA